MSLAVRLTLTYLLVTLAGLLLLGGSFIALVNSALSRQNQQELAAQTAIFAGLVAELAASPAEVQALAPGLVDSASVPPGVTARIFAANGTLLSNPAGLGPFPSRPVRELLETPFPLPISQADERRYAAQLVPGAQEPLAVVEFSRSTAAETALLADLRGFLIQATLLAGLLVLLVSVWLGRSIARPLVRLAGYAEAIADGTTPAAVGPVTGINEVQRLSTSLAHMAGQLHERLNEARRERIRLELVLASISEGVIAVDQHQSIVFANQAARLLLGVTWDCELAPILRSWHLAMPPQHSLDLEIEHAQRILALRINPVLPAAAAPVEPAEGPVAVLVLRDISRLKELEQARGRFFRSVSHDLRTPLTAIRGTIENLLDSAPEHEQPALATLETEALRLSRLVEELLNPPESGLLVTDERSRIDLAALLEEMALLQQGRARRAGIRLEHRIAAGAAVAGDRDRLKQALLNLIDNALKVTPPGGHIRLRLERVPITNDSARARLIVADSGPGVPPADRERIWERGVRSDEYGGSGLGLAIVREIAAAHAGHAYVEANQPAGARFVLELPAL